MRRPPDARAAAALALVLVACAFNGKPRVGQRTPCDEACGSGRTCNAAYPLSPCMPIAGAGGRCGSVKDCKEGLECFQDTCAPEGTTEKEGRAACRDYPTAEGPAWCAAPFEWLTRHVAGNVRYEPNPDLSVVRSIRRGVLVPVVSAEGRNRTALAELLRQLPPTFDVVLGDALCIRREVMVLPELGCPRSTNLPIMWIRNGSITATSLLEDTSGYAPNIRALAALP